MTEPTTEAQAIAWAEHSLERNEAVAALFRLLPDSMFPESFDALMERVVAIEALAAVRAGAAAGSGICGYFSRGGYVHFCDLPADHPWHVGPHRHHDFRPRPATPPTPALTAAREVPEELRKWLLAVDREHTGTVPGGVRLRHGRCTTCGMLKVGLDAYATPPAPAAEVER